ncbi:hypothetical protein EYW49_09205 [Siculibacillus lacustris]|uniref:Uncharacterized protein n=1 Tax=Siculibacillus lacustris TaxID=1549641 RepID=A0A4Q9VRB9_9HYPH|nr:hypothetical protein [Siculibacillus lacustris]TBW38438.1 hypothetical protein EYW49_09205 [Siculibacillus lacustris]
MSDALVPYRRQVLHVFVALARAAPHDAKLSAATTHPRISTANYDDYRRAVRESSETLKRLLARDLITGTLSGPHGIEWVMDARLSPSAEALLAHPEADGGRPLLATLAAGLADGDAAEIDGLAERVVRRLAGDVDPERLRGEPGHDLHADGSSVP